MKTNRVKSALKEGQAQIGTWLSLASPLAARYMARAGFHWLTVDIEHSPVDWETAALMFGAIADTGGVPLARVPINSPDNAKRALDSGAFGIVFPMCCTAAEAEQAVDACRYPPQGRRSVGGSLHALNFGGSPGEYYRRANDEILILVQIEHVLGVENCEAICRTEGLDGVFVGPNDLLASMHKTPAMETDDPAFVDALRHIRTTAAKCGIAPGLHVADAEAARRRRAEGWRFLAISSELGFMMQAAHAVVAESIGATADGVARY